MNTQNLAYLFINRSMLYSLSNKERRLFLKVIQIIKREENKIKTKIKELNK